MSNEGAHYPIFSGLTPHFGEFAVLDSTPGSLDSGTTFDYLSAPVAARWQFEASAPTRQAGALL